MEKEDEIIEKLDFVIKKLSQEKENISTWRVAALRRISKAIGEIDNLIEIIETEMISIEEQKQIPDRSTNIVPMKSMVALVPQITDQNNDYIEIINFLKLIREELLCDSADND